MTSQALKADSEPQVAILLVEPEVLSRLVLADYLRGCGYVVHESGSATEALEMLDATLQIDMVLAEVHNIGPMNGFELAHTIRRTHAHVDVILTSSLSNTAEKCHQLCEHRVIKKPYTPQDIVDHIKLLRQKRRTRTTP